jgi:hypothetical protein
MLIVSIIKQNNLPFLKALHYQILEVLLKIRTHTVRFEVLKVLLLKSSGTSHWITGWVLTDISKDCSAFILGIKQYKKNGEFSDCFTPVMKTWQSSELSETVWLMTGHHIPESLNCQACSHTRHSHAKAQRWWREMEVVKETITIRVSIKRWSCRAANHFAGALLLNCLHVT